MKTKKWMLVYALCIVFLVLLGALLKTYNIDYGSYLITLGGILTVVAIFKIITKDSSFIDKWI